MSDSNREWGPQSRGYKSIKQSVTIDAQDYDNLLWEFELFKKRHAALVAAAKAVWAAYDNSDTTNLEVFERIEKMHKVIEASDE